MFLIHAFKGILIDICEGRCLEGLDCDWQTSITLSGGRVKFNNKTHASKQWFQNFRGRN